MDTLDNAFAWGFGVVAGIGCAIWLLDAVLGVDLLLPFRKEEDK